MGQQKVRPDVTAIGPFVLSGSLLNGALNISQTNVIVDAGTDFQIGDVIRVDAEEMAVTNIVAATLTVATRPANSTIAATHLDNTPVYVRPFEVITVSSTAIGPTAARIPAGCVKSVYNLETDSVRYRTGTSKPTATVGHILRAPASFVVTGEDITKIKFIRVTSDATLTVSHEVEG